MGHSIADLKVKLGRLTPGWFAAIAGSAVAGATLVPSHKLIAGAAAGIGMLAIALRLTPCCEGCVPGSSCGSEDVKVINPNAGIAVGEPNNGGLDERDPKRPFDGTPILGPLLAPTLSDAGCVGCAGGDVKSPTMKPEPGINPWDGTGISGMRWEFS